MRYTTDLSDHEWQLLKPSFPRTRPLGRPREHSYRELLNAMFCLIRTGCQWRNLPTDFAPWGTVYHYYRTWKQTSLWERLHTQLRQQVRHAAQRQRQPSAGVVDSQSIKSSECSDQRGYDASKKINCRKRHLLVDTLGLVLLVLVLPANLQDRDGERQLLDKHFGRRTRRHVKHVWADGDYTGTLVAWVLEKWRCTVEIVKRTELHTFKVLPRRWVVERTFGWLNRYRRLSRDYERQAKTGETMVYLAMIRPMLARLADT